MFKFLKKIKFISIFWVFFYLFVFGLLLQHSYSYLDPDLGWHLKVGQEISLNQTVPQINHYNYTFTGNWVDHEWLTNWAVYDIYDSWGYLGLNVIFSGLVVLILIILTIFTKQLLPRAPGILIAFLQLFGLIASLPHFGVRVQELNLLFLVLLLIIIYYYNKTKKFNWLIALPPLFYLWVNLHGGFLLGLFLLLAFILIKLFEKIVLSRLRLFWISLSEMLSYREIAIFSSFTLLSVVATFFTPYYFKLYSFLGGYGNTFYLSHIQEWLSQFHFPFNYWQLAYLAMAVVFLSFYGFNLFHNRKTKLNLWTISLIVLFFALSFQSRRHFPLFFIVSFPFLVENIVHFFNLKKKLGSFFDFKYKLFIAICLLMAVASQLININFINQPFTDFCQDYPCGAIEFLQTTPQYDPLNIFNEYNWGDFMIWVYPERKIFIDGRLPQIEFAGHTFLEEYISFYKKDVDYLNKFNEYDVKLILMRAEDKEIGVKKWEKIIFRIKDEELEVNNYLRDYLMRSNDWQAVYEDSTAIIYLNNN